MSGRASHLVAITLLLGACSAPGESASGGAPEVERVTVGDTLVVRTLSGSVWGGDARLVPEVSIGEFDGELEYLFGNIRSLAVAEDGTIYVLDGQIPELRAYDADGAFLRVVGRPGEGPGEIKRPDGGLAVLSDGRVLVRDPGNARIQVYSAEGEPLDSWGIRGGFNTSSPFYQTARDEVHAMVLVDPEADVRDWVIGMVRIGPDGVPGDTLVPLDAGYEAPTVEARSSDAESSSVSINSVPFSPSEEWTIHRDGYFVYGLSTEYRFTLLKPDGAIRIERAYEPVAITRGEKAEAESNTIRNMRRTQPNWRWNGPEIPDVKPPFASLYAGRDGRIWVRVSQPGIEVDDPDYDPKDPDSIEDRWREPVAFDVFQEDGTYLGKVVTEMGFSASPTPVFGSTQLWATTRDALGVQRVVRYRIEIPPDTQDGLTP